MSPYLELSTGKHSFHTNMNMKDRLVTNVINVFRFLKMKFALSLSYFLHLKYLKLSDLFETIGDIESIQGTNYVPETVTGSRCGIPRFC